MALNFICFDKYYKFLKMNQQEKEKRKHIDENSQSQNDNSEAEQGENEQQNSMDDFIAGDDEEVSDDYVPRRFDDSDDSGRGKKSKKLKKKQKRRLKRLKDKQNESQLDEGDLDVMEQQQLEGGRLNRLKKKTQKRKISYSDQDEEEQMKQFVDRDDQELSQSGGYQRQSEDQSGLQQIFEQQGGDIFQPEDQKRFFQDPEDKQIINMDIPQRYYYQLRSYAQSHNISIEETMKIFQQQDRNAQVKWIYTKGKFNQNLRMQQRQVKQKIRNVLEALHKQKIEIMFIYYYRRKAFFDVLTRDDLWRIYKLDQQWFAYKEQFVRLRDNLMNVIFSFQEMPRLENMIQQTVDMEKLKYFREFQAFKLQQSNMGSKKNHKYQIITQIRDKGVEQWLKKSQAFLSPQNLCHNLIMRSHDKKAKNPLYEPREELQKVLKSPNPENDKVRFPLLVPEKRIQTICHYLQLQLFTHPQLRQYLKEQYYKHLILSTSPTAKGQQDINLYSQFFLVKKIKNKPVRTLEKEVWILAQEAEKRELITIQLRFDWQQSGVEQRNFEGDTIFNNIMKYYYEISVHKQGEVWNLFRKQVITKMLTDYFFPSFFKQIKEELTKEGEQIVIKESCEGFKKKLLMSQNNKRILAMVLQDKKLGIVYVDQFGVAHSPLQITLLNDEELKKFAKDEIITKYIQDFKPQAICIGANSRRAQTLRKAIRETDNLPFCSLCPYEVASLVAKQRRLQGSSQQITILQAISMARCEKNPMLETLTLWSGKVQQNGILSMNLHQFQSFIDQRRLKDALELVAIQIVNLVGIDINQLKYRENDAGRKILQFVCGLGPRKAYDFYQKIRNQTIFNRQEIQELVSGKNVFKNCSSFFKIETPYHKALLDKSEKQKKKDKQHSNINLLDCTRIPMEWYKLTESLILKTMKTTSFDMRQRKIYTNYSEETIGLIQMFKNPERVNSIQWIWKRQQLPFFDEKLIKEEFMFRFRMPNESKYEFTSQELFYSLLRETKYTLKKYQIVTVKIIKEVRETDKYLNVVIPENGLFGSIKIHQVKPEYQRGNFIKAIITGFPFQQSSESRGSDGKQQQLLKVEMSLSFPHKSEEKGQDHNCFENCFKNIVKEIHPLIDLEKDRFDLKKQDRPVLQVREDAGRSAKTQFRKISHKKFKNLAVGPAIELIRSSPVGEFVIRPSSDGIEFLNITWHFFKDIIAHIKVRSQQKNITTSAPIYRIISDKDNKVYESLDKIIDEYIMPMNALVQDVTSNRKFLSEPIDRIQEKLRIQNGKDASLIHYFFGCSAEYPQYFLLIYMYRQKKSIKQLIKVRSTGLYFHDQVFGNIRELIGWFKNHFKERDYQSFVKKYSVKK